MLIVDMKMPERCGACPCRHVEFDIDRVAVFCALLDNEFVEDPDSIPTWCPIKGVLPDEHGDLIDRDAFIHKYLAFYTEQERKKNLVFAAVEVKQQFADMICDERAVIAAERKDDGR